MLVGGLGLLVLALPFLLLASSTPKLAVPTAVEPARLAEFPEGTIRYQDEGAGDAVLLFLHGFNQDLGQWSDVWSRLSGCGARRLRLDLPGFGGSPSSADDFGLPAQAARVIALLDRLEVGKVTLVGTSMGGSLSAWIAAHHPERVGSLALLAPSGFPGSLHYPGLYGRLLRPGALNQAATWVARTWLYRTLFPRSGALQALTVAASYGERWSAALQQIRAPTLVVWSTADSTTLAAAAVGVRQAIQGSTLLWLDAATGHAIPNTRPELIAAVACGLAEGRGPAEVVSRLRLRPGDGLAP